MLFLGLINVSLTGWGQVYKWVDDKGVTHYTETPPPGGKSQAMKTPPRNPTGDKMNPQPAAKSWQEQEIEFRQRRVEAEEAKQRQDTAEARARREAALRRESCIDARHNLQNLLAPRPIYGLDERGERRYVEDKDRPELIRKAKSTIEKDCPSP